MPPELAMPRPRDAFGLGAIPAPWRAPLVRLALVWAALLAVFAADWATMAALWWNVSTYNHILLVPAIVCWLVWVRARDLAPIVPSEWWPGLAGFALALLVWVLGAISGFNLLRQAGVVLMLIASVPALLGPRVGAGLAFPLGYMLFLIPFGEELIPPLQTITAKMTVFLVQATHVPATIDGVFIQTPAGLFEVAAACSGVKFLIAMVALGVLVGNVGFVRWRRRAAFLALCIAVPVLANGVRAWGTVYAAQIVGAKRAGGIDHLIYGWFFFAFVIAAVLALSWRWFDRAPDAPLIDGQALLASPRLARLERRGIGWKAALGILALLVAGSEGWAGAAARVEAAMPARIAFPQVPGWVMVDYAPTVGWMPRAGGAAHRLIGRYADPAGDQVDVFVALYAAQDDHRKAGGFGEGALTPDSGWAWMKPGPAAPRAKSEFLLTHSTLIRLAETTYHTGAVTTGSNVRLKLANIADRLVLRPRATSMLILSAEARPGHDPAAAIARFRTAIGDEGEWLDRIAANR